MDSLNGTVTRTILHDRSRRAAGSLRRSLVLVALAASFTSCAVDLTCAQTGPTSTLLNFSTNMGSFQVDLFDPLVPTSVANFLQHVNAGDMSNTLVHRSVISPPSSFGIIQGGGLVSNDSVLTHTGPFNGIGIEYRMDNFTGTIGMARSSQPNSATTEWFINTSDNSTGFNQSNGGGYTVFGQVMAGGMGVVNNINALPRSTVQGWQNLPLRNWTSPATPVEANYVFTNSITVDKTHPAFQNPNTLLGANTVLDVNNDGIISPADAVSVINNLALNHGIHSATTYIDARYRYVDTNGNGQISAADAVKVINYLIKQQAQAVSHSLTFTAMSPQTSVPEPSSSILGIIGAAALTGFAWRHLRRRARA